MRACPVPRRLAPMNSSCTGALRATTGDKADQQLVPRSLVAHLNMSVGPGPFRRSCSRCSSEMGLATAPTQAMLPQQNRLEGSGQLIGDDVAGGHAPPPQPRGRPLDHAYEFGPCHCAVGTILDGVCSW